ncbi:ribonuclease E inhibitor RraB [Actinotalea ferrariae]|uniref:ribonuclease E inhibitor RraB n=1 Tax=Actinotalea ferrariae TaxID=1386098 RepID=UPI001C8B41A3|nr:ribonuclease E inhibitor RraB [Actinotalea ferrariae]MBX9245972.1 ribonuclease E inhibitor RraB [Actinotalea ferrariae]
MGWSLRTMLSRFDRRPIDPEERSPQLGLKYKDLMLLDAIQKQGGDLLAPRHVLHYLYFASSGAAARARDELVAAGWHAQARDPLSEYPDQWGVVAEQHDVVLEPDFVRTATDLMEAVAARGDGEYDGWEASA